MRPVRRVDVLHHVVCRHQVEVEVWPPRVELYFADERWTDRIDTQARFEANVINSGRGVEWRVLDPDGGPGAGSIDATGLYRAPAKGALASGHTEIVVATAVEDPLRKATAWVTLLGEGPLPAPLPRIEICPRRVDLYYKTLHHNAYIDDSNKVQLFQATIRHSANQNVVWSLASGAGSIGADGLYQAPASGFDHGLAVVRGTIAGTGVYDEARILLRNYDWPGLT